MDTRSKKIDEIFPRLVKGWAEDDSPGTVELLHYYILHKVSEYIEPVRQGTPKGERIGFSWIKYVATLCFLSSVSHRRISEILKISYGLLRKWRSEEPFKEQIGINEKEFSELFIRASLKEIAQKYQQPLEAPFDNTKQQRTLYNKELKLRSQLFKAKLLSSSLKGKIKAELVQLRYDGAWRNLIKNLTTDWKLLPHQREEILQAIKGKTLKQLVDDHDQLYDYILGMIRNLSISDEEKAKLISEVEARKVEQEKKIKFLEEIEGVFPK